MFDLFLKYVIIEMNFSKKMTHMPSFLIANQGIGTPDAPAKMR